MTPQIGTSYLILKIIKNIREIEIDLGILSQKGRKWKQIICALNKPAQSNRLEMY